MYDAKDLVNVMKKVSTDANSGTKPTAITFGTVTSTEPLAIYIEDKVTLLASCLVLMASLTDKTVKVTIGENTYDGIVENALAVGDKVALIRMQGGKKYVVLDKVVV